MTLWLKVPQPCYLWLVEEVCVIVFPCSAVGVGLLRVRSVSFFSGIQPQVSG